MNANVLLQLLDFTALTHEEYIPSFYSRLEKCIHPNINMCILTWQKT